MTIREDQSIDPDMKLKMIVGKAAAIRNKVGENCPQHILDRINKELHFVEIMGLAPLFLYSYYYSHDNGIDDIGEIGGLMSDLYISYLLGLVYKNPKTKEY